MFLITIFCFVVGLLHWTTQLSAIVILVRTALVETLDLSLQDRAALANHRIQVPNLIVAWSRFLPVVSDAVVVWRAWVLFTDQRWLLAFPIILLTATTVVTFTFLGYTTQFTRHASSLAAVQPAFIAKLFTARITLSLATNAVATLLIAYKLRNHRRIVKTLGLGKGTSGGQKALLLLIESGAVYCALQVVNVALSLAALPGGRGGRAQIASQVFFAGYTMISAMYPTTIVVLVNTQRSFVDSYSSGGSLKGKTLDFNSDEGTQRATVGHLSFARGDDGGRRPRPVSSIFYTSIKDDVETPREKGEDVPLSEDRDMTPTTPIREVGGFK
jgi:hypothetical protein